MTTTTITDARMQTTLDQQNNLLSLQLLRLYASPSTLRYFVLRRVEGTPIPTFAEFVPRLMRMGN